MLHHLMVGTWTPPGAIFTFEFDDVLLTLKMINRTAIPEDEPISWLTFDVSTLRPFHHNSLTYNSSSFFGSITRKIYMELP